MNLKLAFAIALYVVAVVVLWQNLSTIRLDDVWQAVETTPMSRIYGAAALTLLSFACFAGLEMISARTVTKGRISMKMAAFAGTCGNAVSNVLGFHVVTGIALRYRLYMTRGVSLPDATRIMALTGAGICLGFAAAFALSLLSNPAVLKDWGPPVGTVLAVAVFGVMLWTCRRRTLRFRRWTFALPTARSGAAQVVIGMIEMTAAAGALFLLLPSGTPVFGDFMMLYMGAILFGRASVTPGGIGVFEAAIIAALVAIDKEEVLGALLLYRFIYNVVPFSLAVLGVLGFEVHHRLRGNSMKLLPAPLTESNATR